MILNQDDSLFLIIDIQEKLLNAVFNKEIVDKNSKILVKAAEILNIPVLVTEQYPQGLGKTTVPLSLSTEVYEKFEFNALSSQILLNKLKDFGRKQIIVIGIETHICVHQTVEALLGKDFKVTVAKDCCGSRTEYQYNTGLENMKENGASIKSTEMILFELVKSSKHPNFKQIQTLIK